MTLLILHSHITPEMSRWSYPSLSLYGIFSSNFFCASFPHPLQFFTIPWKHGQYQSYQHCRSAPDPLPFIHIPLYHSIPLRAHGKLHGYCDPQILFSHCFPRYSPLTLVHKSLGHLQGFFSHWWKCWTVSDLILIQVEPYQSPRTDAGGAGALDTPSFSCSTLLRHAISETKVELLPYSCSALLRTRAR